jgi:glycosyltransferase involved in cell wall biosynthesis
MKSQQNWDIVFSADNVATATLLVMRRKHLLRCPVVCLLIGVPDWLEGAKPDQRDNTLHYLSAADCIVVLGKAEVTYLRSNGLTQTRFLPFGIDTEFWAPTGESIGDYFFALGSDTGRDYETLIQACPYPLKIMTRLRDLTKDPIPPNITIVRTGELAEARTFISRARVVVVPLKDRLQPSGQSTVLQAMAMSKPVILTQTRGTWTEQLRDTENCIYVRPGDTNGLHAAIEMILNDSVSKEIGSRARRTVVEFFNIRHLVDGWMKIISEVL